MTTSELFPQSAVTSSRADSLVSRFPNLGSSEARKMTASSGRQCSTLLKGESPFLSLVKTLLESSTWSSTAAYLIWKPSVTKSNRLLFQLVPSELGTAGTGFGLLPTISKSDGKGCAKKRFKGSPEYKGSKMTEGVRTSLNDPIYLHPNFAAEVMGYPKNWAHTETPSSRKSQK